MASNKEKKLKRAIIVLSILLAISLSALIYLLFRFRESIPVIVPDNLITTGSIAGTETENDQAPAVRVVKRETEILGISSKSKSGGTILDWKTTDDEVLKLYDGQEYDQKKFSAVNMFPGDEEQKEYCVEVYHVGQVDVDFMIKNIMGSDLAPKDTKLAEVLQYQVEAEVISANGKEIDPQTMKIGPFHGFVQDYLDHSNELISIRTPDSNGRKPTQIVYRITMFLDGPSVTNEYMNKTLFLDFEWRVPDTVPEFTGPGGDEDSESTAESKPEPEEPTTEEPTTEEPTTEESTPEEPTTPPYIKPDDDHDGDNKGDAVETSAQLPTDIITDETVPSSPGHLVVLPITGDNTILIFGAALIAGALLVLLIIAKRRKEEEHEA